jgi:hypothetical protein
MGLDINAVRFLIAARRAGVEFGEVLTLGRQDLNVFPAKMVQVLEAQELPSIQFQPFAQEARFAEPVFKALGAREVFSIDVSAFEGASFIHDLNQPVGPDLQERFNVVYDGGTLEHVFNFPVALRNCMEMVRLGGRLFIHTVANNYCGHGFYQFSPELFFRALSEENGFTVERMVLHRMGPYGRWYEVADPEEIRSRVELVTFMPVQLLIQARRTRVTAVFGRTPQQSDYTPRWQDPTSGHADAEAGSPPKVVYGPVRTKLSRVLPNVARLFHVARMGLELYRTQTLRNRRNFHPVKKP